MKHLTARPDVSMLPEPYRTIVARALAKDPNQRPAPGLRPAAARRRSRASPRSGSSARAAGRAPVATPAPVGPRRRTSCGSRPRSRSSTSAPTPGRRGRGIRYPRASPGQLAGSAATGHVPAAGSTAGSAPGSRPITDPTPAGCRHLVPQPRRLRSFPAAGWRVAELAASMVWAAPIVALLVLPAIAAGHQHG